MPPRIKRKANTPAPEPAPAVPLPDPVVAVIDRIVAHWAAGKTFVQIVETLKIPMTGPELRTVIMRDAELRARLNAEHGIRAHTMIDKVVEWCEEAAMQGNHKVAIDTYLKLAARLSPSEHSDVSKVELTGKNGGPLQVKADLTLSPADAYERMVSGK